MANITETMDDAAASADTSYSMAPGDTFAGRLDERSDEDWIRIELEAGLIYQISLAGAGADGAADTILRIYNAAGQQVAINDDVDRAADKLDSELRFSPESSGVYYISAGSYSANPNQENWGDYRLTVLTLGRADAITGTDGADEMTGTEGDDQFEGSPGADTIRGGAGNDTVSYEFSDGSGFLLDVNLDSGRAIGGYAQGDTFPGRQTIEYVDADGNLRQAEVPDIENLRGSEYGDRLTGAHGPNRLEGLGGDDDLHGLGGDDALEGGEGDDNLFGGPGNDRLDGGEDDDELTGDSGIDELDGGAGDDFLEGGPGADALRGGPGSDTAYYQYSDAGVEVRLADAVALGGDAQGDTFAGRQIVEYVDAAGRSRQASVPDIENLRGSEHDDILIGGPGVNELNGGGGDDVLDGREGDDRLFGDDWFSILFLVSTSGDDHLNGGAGNDWLEGGTGADELRGGPGEDTASYEHSGDHYTGVEVLLYNGTARGSDAEGDTFVGMQTLEYVDVEGNRQEIRVPDIENLFGSSGNDILAGAHGPNRLDGYEGNDRLDGREGNDALMGGAGFDVLMGGPGADMLSGGAETDTASYEFSDAGVVVRLHTVLESGGQGGDAEGDMFSAEMVSFTDAGGNTRQVELPDIENLLGSDHDDVLAGDFRDNIIRGQAGNDLVYGGPGGGHDLLFGGYGDDQVYGGEGYDWLFGGYGDDLLKGGPGNDTLELELEQVDEERSNEFETYFKKVRYDYGDDRLEGGAGDDYFFFYPDGGNDTILDFGNGEDRIVLKAFEDIQSLADLAIDQQGNNLVIDLSAQGGGTITLQDYDEADLMDSHLVFHAGESATVA